MHPGVCVLRSPGKYKNAPRNVIALVYNASHRHKYRGEALARGGEGPYGDEEDPREVLRSLGPKTPVDEIEFASTDVVDLPNNPPLPGERLRYAP